MSLEPDSPQNSPYILELEAGTHAWCACGRSIKQPFCDGTHAGTDFQPVVFQVDHKRKAALCGCKRTQGPPHCDGTHSKT